ncbi:hypothetical protein BB561_001270 [Smittium simulii]|uniref:Uncharacterized protein n=1 Tax=Smittium simulii TaxID=133385 RepID=A0A2T9YVD5_9FUNG|nr:hypothetical protein BB561_001270 [Smittium simulii]
MYIQSVNYIYFLALAINIEASSVKNTDRLNGFELNERGLNHKLQLESVPDVMFPEKKRSVELSPEDIAQISNEKSTKVEQVEDIQALNTQSNNQANAGVEVSGKKSRNNRGLADFAGAIGGVLTNGVKAAGIAITDVSGMVGPILSSISSSASKMFRSANGSHSPSGSTKTFKTVEKNDLIEGADKLRTIDANKMKTKLFNYLTKLSESKENEAIKKIQNIVNKIKAVGATALKARIAATSEYFKNLPYKYYKSGAIYVYNSFSAQEVQTAIKNAELAANAKAANKVDISSKIDNMILYAQKLSTLSESEVKISINELFVELSSVSENVIQKYIDDVEALSGNLNSVDVVAIIAKLAANVNHLTTEQTRVYLDILAEVFISISELF